MRRVCSGALILALFISMGSGMQIRAAAAVPGNTSAALLTGGAEGTYGSVLAQKAAAPSGKNLELIAGDAVRGQPQNSSESWTWRFAVPTAGRYYIKLRYGWDASQTSEITCSLQLNGKTPYQELSYFSLPREYTQTGAARKDIYGNDIRRQQQVASRVTENYLFDYDHVYTQPLSVDLNAGANTVRLDALSGSPRIVALILEPAGNIRLYSQYQDAMRSAGAVQAAGPLTLPQGEDYAYVSDSTIYPVSDESSALTSPSKAGKILLNAVGGKNWDSVGQYAAWNVTVKQAGLYRISLRVLQNLVVGQASARTVMINGEIPFSEAMEVSIPYSSKWQTVTLGGDGQEYLFYLKKGTNEIRLMASLGVMDSMIRTLDDTVTELNKIYRKFLIIMGSTPDLLRDYRLGTLLPGQVAALKTQANRLQACADYAQSRCGNGNEGVALIHTMVRQLLSMNADPDTIPREFSYFKSNIGSLGTWIDTAKTQPLEIDELAVGNDTAALPCANAGFFTQFGFSLMRFLYSYIINYQDIGETQETVAKSGDPLTIWIGVGNEQAQIVRDMIAKTFTPQTHIPVKLQLVTTSLLPSTVAGVGPDAVIQSAPDVIDFAMRHAAYSLSSFSDCKQVTERFHPALLVRLKYLGNVYGLPETISYPMLFYRQDILSELGLEVPKTWDDVIRDSTVLSKNNMEFGMQSGDAGYMLLLSQNGLNVYENGGETCVLDSPASIRVFKFYTDLFTNYGFPLSYSFINRFRSGEIPIGVANFSFYNELSVAAPEINGLWSMAELPGVRGKDGKIDNVAVADTQACMILQNSNKHQQAWNFLKWWTSAEVQTEFASRVESVLGASGRYNSANMQAFQNSLWSRKDLSVLQQQAENLTAIPNVPGGYYLSRNVTNAFRAVVYHGLLPTDALYDYTFKINSELTSKRREFGLSVR